MIMLEPEFRREREPDIAGRPLTPKLLRKLLVTRLTLSQMLGDICQLEFRQGLGAEEPHLRFPYVFGHSQKFYGPCSTYLRRETLPKLPAVLKFISCRR